MTSESVTASEKSLRPGKVVKWPFKPLWTCKSCNHTNNHEFLIICIILFHLTSNINHVFLFCFLPSSPKSLLFFHLCCCNAFHNTLFWCEVGSFSNTPSQRSTPPCSCLNMWKAQQSLSRRLQTEGCMCWFLVCSSSMVMTHCRDNRRPPAAARSSRWGSSLKG